MTHKKIQSYNLFLQSFLIQPNQNETLREIQISCSETCKIIYQYSKLFSKFDVLFYSNKILNYLDLGNIDIASL